MSSEVQNTAKYYGSGILQVFFIALTTLLLYLLVGATAYGYNSPSEPEEILELNIFTIIFLFSSLIFGSVIFYIIFTKLKSIGIRVVYSFVLFIPYLLLAFDIWQTNYTTEVSLFSLLVYLWIGVVLIFGGTFMYVYASGMKMVKFRNFGIILSSVIIARTISLFFDLGAIIAFALILSIFDIFSVFKGPLSKIMGKPSRIDQNGVNHLLPDRQTIDYKFKQICQRGVPVLLSYQNTLLGVGDVLFFSILMFKGLLVWNFIGFFVTMVMIIIGSSGTLFLLRRITPLPGIPLPVVTSLLGYLGLYLFL